MSKEERKQYRREFLEYYLFSSIPSIRWGLLVNLLLFFVFVAVNELAFPGNLEFRYFNRFGIVIPFFLISILVLFFRKLRPWLSTIFIVLNGLLCVAIFLVGATSGFHERGYEYYFAWVMLMTIGLYTFYRLQFTVILILGGFQLVAYILANMVNHSFTEYPVLSVNSLFFIIGAAILGFFIAFSFQHLNKKNFLHQKSLESQYKKLLAEFTEKVSMEAELIQASEQKVIMMKEIHHRVKNNLAIVISMLGLQMRQTPDPELKRIIRDIEMRIRSMALIHEHLYRSEDLDKIKLHEYIKSLSTIILSTFSASHINLEADLQSLDVPIETALPIGLITNELITNAVKYAFPEKEKGTIRITLHPQEKEVLFSVTDDGIGLPEGFEIDRQPTLGVFMVKLLVEQISGKLVVSNNQGASFTIRFPMNSSRKLFTQ